MHITTKTGKKTPSSFIPFCEFGGDMTRVGRKIDDFDVPVCDSFEAKILNDQLCYEVNLNKYSDKDNIKKELKLGLNFVMDYNEDRQVVFNQGLNKSSRGQSLASQIVESDENQHALIYLNTVGG